MTGREVIAELVEELRGSVAVAEQFEGEMRNLAAYAKALAQALDCIRTAGGNRFAPHAPQSPHTHTRPQAWGEGWAGKGGSKEGVEGRVEEA